MSKTSNRKFSDQTRNCISCRKVKCFRGNTSNINKLVSNLILDGTFPKLVDYYFTETVCSICTQT